MARGLPIAALLAAGCFSPTVEEGATCSPERECPPGQTCADDGRCYSAAPAFRFRRRIDLHPPSGNAVLRDFPLAVALTGDPDLTAHAADDGLDIHFVDDDGASELDFEVESFDRAAGELVAWVRVPVLSAEDSIYLEYGGDPRERPAPADVWNPRYLAVWHGAAGGDASLLADSTANHNDGRSGDGQAPERVPGAAGAALSFDGVDDQVVIDETVPLVELGGATDIVLSMWVELAEPPVVAATALGRGAQSGNEAGFGVQLGSNWILRLRGTGSSETLFASFGFASALAGRWVLLGATIVHQEKGQQAFEVTTSVDGEEVGSGYWICQLGPCGLDLGGPLTFSHPDARFAGLIDEVRIVDRSIGPENLRAEYENLANPEAFYTVGAEETLPL